MLSQLRLACLGFLFFCLTCLTQAQTFNVINQFDGNPNWMPYSGVTLDPGGNLYGTTTQEGVGTVYKLKHTQNGWTISTLFQFDEGGGPHGSWPWAGVVFGPDGALFGTTDAGGTNNKGLVYKLTPPRTTCRSTRCYWTETVLYNFAGGSDGAYPGYGNVIFDHAGNVYGTTTSGGASPACPSGCGVVYELSHSAAGWTEQVLHRFAGGTDGADPLSGLLLDAAGNLYGTTAEGGGTRCQHGCGTIFELSPSGNDWTERILYRFQGENDGANPLGTLVPDPSGNLFGSTTNYGSQGGGTVYELLPAGETWTFFLLYSLPESAFPGGGPGQLARDSRGDLYGVTLFGGDNGTGSVFELTPQNGLWVYTPLHSFSAGLGIPDGYEPLGAPVLDSNGNLYGTASEGGVNACDFEIQCGTVWEITP